MYCFCTICLIWAAQQLCHAAHAGAPFLGIGLTSANVPSNLLQSTVCMVLSKMHSLHDLCEVLEDLCDRAMQLHCSKS